jgi:NAD(P)-dependent dehydrogenase (short-subunit alcohol dehydrogenase family)
MGQVVLVTGCRSGIGLAIATEAARAGHTVYAGLRDPSLSPDLLLGASGLSIIPLPLDVTQADQRAAAVARIISDRGRLDVLVNNAGIALGGFLEQVAEDELRRLYDVNVFGAWAMTRAVLPHMRAAGSGLIVLVSSMAGRMAIPGLGAYASSKFALEAMGEAFRHELAPFGVRVVLLEPGAYRTEIFGRNRTIARGALDPASPYAPFVARLNALVGRIVDRIARDPLEVGRLVVSLFGVRRLALRYPIGPWARLRSLLLRLAPFTLFEIVYRRALADRGRGRKREPKQR